MKKLLYFLPVLLCGFGFNAATAQNWSLSGNSDANNSSVLGTRNLTPLKMIVNNIERARIDADGTLSLGTTSGSASAILNIRSTTKGILLPRMTKTQRNAISAPATGLMIYQTDNGPGLYYYRGGWKKLAEGGLADQYLSNLNSPTAVNVNLSPLGNSTVNLGEDTANWKSLYLGERLMLHSSSFLSAPGNGNNYFGTAAGDSMTTGTYNTATGYYAMLKNNIGYGNTANGYYTLYNNKNSYNTAEGYLALTSNASGYANTASGAFALYGNVAGAYNVGFGADALINLSSGNNNTAVGLDALREIRTTSYNTGIGSYAGVSSTDVSQGTFLGANSRASSGMVNVTAVGYNAIATASNQVMLGNTSVTSVLAAGSYVIYSDGRFKKDISENVPGLTFINELRPVTYHYNIHNLNKFISPAEAQQSKGVVKEREDSQSSNKQVDEASMIAKEKILYTGFVAQEVENAAKKLNYDFSGVHKPANSSDVYGLSYSDFVVPLVKAVQELSKKNEELEKKADRVEELETRIARLEALLSNEKNAVNTANLTTISLQQNTPNPFSGATVIAYNIPENSKSAQLVIKDLNGKTLSTMALQPGKRGSVNVDGTMLSSGTYNYSIIVNGKVIATKKMVVVRQ